MSKHKLYELPTLSSNISNSQQIVAKNFEQTPRLSKCFIVTVVITAIVSLGCLATGLIFIVRYHNTDLCVTPQKVWQEKRPECGSNCSTTLSNTASNDSETTASAPTMQNFTRVPTQNDNRCEFSVEAKRAGKVNFFAVFCKTRSK